MDLVINNHRFDVYNLQKLKEKMGINSNEFQIFKSMFIYLEDSTNEEVYNLSKAFRQEMNKILYLIKKIDFFQESIYRESKVETIEIGLYLDLFFSKYRTLIECLLDIVRKNFPNEKLREVSKIFEYLYKDNNNEIIKFNSEWFKSIFEYRNELLHRSSNCVAFINTNKEIGFQIFDLKLDNIIIEDHIKMNENLIHVKKFIAIYMSHLLIFMDSVFSKMTINRKPEDSENAFFNYSVDTKVLLDWITQTLNDMFD